MKIIRVFPRRTKATPTDELAYFGPPDLFAEADEVHISVTFTYDLKRAEQLAKQWSPVAPVKIGGPATGMKGGEFTPGMYVKKGYVMTSRGCGNGCWFCIDRHEPIRELQITDGHNVLDSNLLKCSDDHIKAVFAMLKRQNKAAQFTGGLEASRITARIAKELKILKPKQLFFAYDEQDDWEPLVEATRLMLRAGFTVASHALRCYVLCGYPKDTFAKAEKRLTDVQHLGLTPMAMLYRNDAGRRDPAWRSFQRQWARPAIIHSNRGDGGRRG